MAQPVFAASDLKPGQIAYFEKQIRPILVEHCYECHSAEAENVKGGLLLDTRAAWELGGDSGPPIIPGDPDGSLLMAAVRYENGDLEMPPKQKLSDAQVAALERWIRMGAPDPREVEAGVALEDADFPVSADELWSLHPVDKKITPPGTKNETWSRTAIDRFVLAKLEEGGLVPVADADPATLLRRLSFDLTGLPPTPEQVASFKKSDLATVVDELLASKSFGVRWGRHWLDVVRYAESNGKSRDRLMPHAWRYRDYVIDSFNADIPYDRFITEQIAGDLLPAKNPAERDRNLIATGLLALGAKTVVAPTAQYQMDLVDDQLDVVGQGILGLTVACSRCHDHKFDPIPTADYYALAGIFRSTSALYGRSGKNTRSAEHETLHVLGPDAEESAAAAREIASEIAMIAKERGKVGKKITAMKKKLPKHWEARSKELSDSTTTEEEATPSDEDQLILEYVALTQQQREFTARDKELKEKQKTLDLDFAMGVRDAAKPADIKIHIRGETGNLGDEVPRAFLSSISLEGTSAIDPANSGRLEFAAWLTHPDHPLTARVAVNRIWQHLFGKGLVATVDNFGINGDAPTHPELLDHLAARFIESGWSVKSLIRDIVTSRVYQLSSDLDEKSYTADPDNNLLWRMSRKRLEAEPLRDAMLAASGELDADPPPFGSAVAQIGNGEVGRGINTGPLHQEWHWRATYLPILRTDMPEYLKLFDYPEPSNPQGVRDDTNVPAQALFLMNNKFVIDRAAAIAKRAAMTEKDQVARITWLYRLCYGREPTASETERLLAFVAEDPENRAERWTTVCHSLIASAEFRYLN